MKEKRQQKQLERMKRIERYNKKHNITAPKPWIDYDYDYIEQIPPSIGEINAKLNATLAPRRAVGQNFNVLVILANQFRHDVIGSSSQAANSHDLSRVAKTPHLSALCKSGMWFKQAVVHAPASVPSRAALLTGTAGNYTGVQRPADTKVIWAGRRTFADVLKRRGYLTLFYGEWVNHIDSLAEFDHTMFSKLLADSEQRATLRYNAKVDTSYTRWLKGEHGILLKKKKRTNSNKNNTAKGAGKNANKSNRAGKQNKKDNGTGKGGKKGNDKGGNKGNGAGKNTNKSNRAGKLNKKANGGKKDSKISSRRRLGKKDPDKKYPDLHSVAGHGLPYRPVAEVPMPLLLKMLQEVDRSKNRTARKSMSRDRIPTWALFGVQPIRRFETKSMYVANKTVKALKAIVDLRKAVDPNKKFAMASRASIT